MPRTPAPADAPLAGVRVADFCRVLAGPFCTRILSDLGAEVIKIEPPDGDLSRRLGARRAGISGYYMQQNCGKLNVSIDLRSARGRELAAAIAARSDVLVENYRPGVMDDLGLGQAALREANPSLVYCSISGFGSSGPYVDRPSYDSVAQALSGFLSVVVDRDRPRFLGPALADAITGIYAAYGVLGALFERSRSGRGRVVEVSMLEAMAHFAVEPFAAYFALGEVPKSSDRPRLAQAHILRTADGGLMAIHLSSLEKFWTALLAALEAPEIASDPRFATRQARIDNYEALGAELDRVFQARPLQEWVKRLESKDVPFAPINSVDAVVEDPQVRHLGLMVPVESPHMAKQSVRPAVQFDGERAASVRPAPMLDEHADAIRAALARGERWPGIHPAPRGVTAAHS